MQRVRCQEKEAKMLFVLLVPVARMLLLFVLLRSQEQNAITPIRRRRCLCSCPSVAGRGALDAAGAGLVRRTVRRLALARLVLAVRHTAAIVDHYMARLVPAVPRAGSRAGSAARALREHLLQLRSIGPA
jgi:hypothetical protein